VYSRDKEDSSSRKIFLPPLVVFVAARVAFEGRKAKVRRGVGRGRLIASARAGLGKAFRFLVDAAGDAVLAWSRIDRVLGRYSRQNLGGSTLIAL